MFAGNSKLENLDEVSKMMMEFVFAQATAETCIKAGAAALQAENYSTAIEETSKGIEIIEKSPEIAEMVAGAMVMLYGMRGSSRHKLGEVFMDASLLQQALNDYNRLLEYADMVDEEQDTPLKKREMIADLVASARNDRTKVLALLGKLKSRNAAAVEKKPWWKIW